MQPEGARLAEDRHHPACGSLLPSTSRMNRVFGQSSVGAFEISSSRSKAK
jgi:hypothetical protein